MKRPIEMLGAGFRAVLGQRGGRQDPQAGDRAEPTAAQMLASLVEAIVGPGRADRMGSSESPRGAQAAMSLDADIDILRGVPFFGGFSSEHLKLIAFSAESRSLPEKLLLYDEGQLLHSADVIVSGSMRAETKTRPGETGNRRTVGPGVLLGERALILDTRANESVRVETRARVLQLRKAMFRRLLQEYPEIARTLRARITRNVVQETVEFQNVALRLAGIKF
jgi:hypothetical protein